MLDGPTLLALVGLAFLILWSWDRWQARHRPPPVVPVAVVAAPSSDDLSEAARKFRHEIQTQLTKALERIAVMEGIIAADRAREYEWHQQELAWQAVYNTASALYGVWTAGTNAPPFPRPPGPRPAPVLPLVTRPNWPNLAPLLLRMGDMIIGGSQQERSTLLLGGITGDWTKGMARSDRADVDLRMITASAARWPPEVQDLLIGNIAAQVHESEWEPLFQEWHTAGRM